MAASGSICCKTILYRNVGSVLFLGGLGLKESIHDSSSGVTFLFLEPVECEIFKSKIGTGSWVGSGCGSQYAGTYVTDKRFPGRKSSSENKAAHRCWHPMGSAPPLH